MRMQARARTRTAPTRVALDSLAAQAVDGKPGDGPLNSNKKDDAEPNVFGFEGAALPPERALEIIAETHASWYKLKSGAVPAGKLQIE